MRWLSPFLSLWIATSSGISAIPTASMDHHPSASIERELASSVSGAVSSSFPTIPTGQVCQQVTSLLASDPILKDSSCVCSQNGTYLNIDCTKGPLCIKPETGDEFSGNYAINTTLDLSGLSASSSIQQVIAAISAASQHPLRNDCFKYDSLYNGARVCLTHNETDCSISIDGTTCNSCKICDLTKLYYSFDCSNVIAEQTKSQCSGNGTSLDGTVLRFEATNISIGTNCTAVKGSSSSGVGSSSSGVGSSSSGVIAHGISTLSLMVVSVVSLFLLL